MDPTATFPALPNPHALVMMGLTVVALYLFTRDRWPLELSSLGLLALMAVGFSSFLFKTSIRCICLPVLPMRL